MILIILLSFIKNFFLKSRASAEAAKIASDEAAAASEQAAVASEQAAVAAEQAVLAAEQAFDEAKKYLEFCKETVSPPIFFTRYMDLLKIMFMFLKVCERGRCYLVDGSRTS